MRKYLFILGVIAILFSGCTQMYNSNEVDVYETNKMFTYKTGIVEDVKKVILKDNGNGVMVGAMSGSVLGSMFGGGKGNVLSTLIGGITGALAGYELDKANGEELFIRLDDGREIVVIVKGVKLKKGDRVRLIMNGNKIIRVEKI